MRVLLIYSNRARILEPAPPIGLSYVATAAQEAGHTVRFVDLMTSKDPERELHDALTGFQPEVVGISIRNIDNIVPQRLAWQLGEVSAIIAAVRKAGTARVVLGGPAISILKAGALERFDADFAVVGEGEITFPLLLAAINDGQNFAAIDGLCYRNGTEIVSNEPVRQRCFGPSGMGNWIKWSAYEKGGGTWAIHTKRGCPQQCIYCNYPAMEGHELRRRSAEEIVDEIEHVKKTINPRTFEFTDSTFNIPPEHAIGICKEIIRRKLKVNLSAVGMNPLGMTEELMALMKPAGFISLVISPDAASETMLKNLHKGFDVERVRQAAQLVRKTGIRSTWFFLLGGPGETQETVDETLSFVEKNLNSSKCLTIVLTGLRVLPGTNLAKLALEEGYLSPNQDLGEPTFYFSPSVTEQWVLDRISRAIAKCPTIVHGAEESGSIALRLFFASLYWLGVPPPYYRCLSMFLSIPPLPALRSRHTGVIASKKGLYVQENEKSISAD